MKSVANITFLLVVSLSLSILLSGCSGDSTGNHFLVASKEISYHTTESLHNLMVRESPNLRGLSPAIGGFNVSGTIELTPTSKFENIIDILVNFFSKYLSHDINTYKIVYNNTNYKGLTGLVVIPKSNTGETFPMIALQHPTQVLRKMSPSNFGTIILDDELTIPLALFLGRAGYIVVVADYPGLGDNKDVHPYCTKRLGPVVTSMMNAVLELLDNKNIKQVFNGDVYLIGYSEGGYATAVTAEDIEKRYSDKFNLKGVTALDGPHSLSETMRNLMLTAGKDYIAPYFLPYVVNGFDDAYGKSVGWKPSTQFVFFHNKYDDLVPYNNSERAYADWMSYKNVSFTTFYEYIPGLGSVHGGAYIPAVIRGFLWIDSKAYPLRQTQLCSCGQVDPLDPNVNILNVCF